MSEIDKPMLPERIVDRLPRHFDETDNLDPDPTKEELLRTWGLLFDYVRVPLFTLNQVQRPICHEEKGDNK